MPLSRLQSVFFSSFSACYKALFWRINLLLVIFNTGGQISAQVGVGANEAGSFNIFLAFLLMGLHYTGLPLFVFTHSLKAR